MAFSKHGIVAERQLKMNRSFFISVFDQLSCQYPYPVVEPHRHDGSLVFLLCASLDSIPHLSAIDIDSTLE